MKKQKQEVIALKSLDKTKKDMIDSENFEKKECNKKFKTAKEVMKQGIKNAN